jgi:hypothetical protein
MGDSENYSSQSQGGGSSSSGASDSSQSSQDQSQSLPPPEPPQNYPICRLPSSSDTLSGVLGEKLLGYISIQVLYLGIPVKDLKLTVKNADGASQIPDPHWAAQHHWKANNPHMTTDAHGRCTLGKRVPIGSYVCKIEHQPDASITTVEDAGRPFVLVLPIGRPYHDFYMQPQE